MDSGEGFNVHQLGNMNRSSLVDLAQVVSQQINNREILGTILDRELKLLYPPCIFRRFFAYSSVPVGWN
jgi:hypothetical protein